MALIQSTAIPSGATDYEIEQSLKFNDDDSAYLEKTLSQDGNMKTFTVSAWVKISSQDPGVQILNAFVGDGSVTRDSMAINNAGELEVIGYNGGVTSRHKSTALLRDYSAWYHILVAIDTTISTADDRVKLYVNGSRITDLATNTNPSLNYEYVGFNNAVPHRIGRTNGTTYGDGYLAEVNFIDGQALTPADLGETGDYGEWKPVEYSGTYGTNGFYLPFKQDYTVEGFSTVTWKGNGGTQYIGGTGFQPDFTWLKARNDSASHALHDSIRGVDKRLYSDATSAEATITNGLLSFNNDGFKLGDNGNYNHASKTYVAWNWDMGGSNASNTDGSITSTVRANATYGQSIVSYTGSGAAATIGHGLSSAPEMVVVKRRESGGWIVGHESNGWGYRMNLESTAAKSSASWAWNDTAPTNAVFSVGSDNDLSASGGTYIAYCFHSVTGYSKFGSYTGNATSGNTITTGFPVAFVMIKRSDGINNWNIFDNTRTPTGVSGKKGLRADESAVEQTGAEMEVELTATGFKINNTQGELNTNSATYIYMAFADKREYAYWLDQSGNNNDWTSNNLTESDVMVDSPTNNFATWNPLSSIVIPTLSEGNLKSGGENNKAMAGTFGVSTGKWYWEINVLNNSQIAPSLGVTKFSMENDPDVSPTLAATSGRSIYRFRATPLYKNFTATAYANDSAHGLADYGILGLALDLDNGTLKYYVNNTLYHTDSTIPSDGTILYPLLTETYAGGSGWNTTVANFGQDSSFAGTKTAQGKQDGNGIGDFYYTPPTGFLALCTKNLPDVDVVPSEHFNTVLWTGDGGSNRAVTGVNFEPNFVWIKSRSITGYGLLFDAVRGANKKLYSSLTNAEFSDTDALLSFEADGFNVGDDNGTNQNSATYVAWNWKANGSGSSNTNGSINSTVSANVDAGFSIVNWTKEGSSGTKTVGHGLSKAPEIIIFKEVDDPSNWSTYVGVGGSTTRGLLYLNLTAAQTTNDANQWSDTAPTSTVFTYNQSYSFGGNNTAEMIGYAFHSVDGYSKVGSYEGNNNADGTFVYTGFQPKFIIIKDIDAAQSWNLYDSVRDTNENPVNVSLLADSSNAEVGGNPIDFLSNGFKLRDGSGMINDAETYIYIAFAETPFKYSNAK